MDIDINWGLGIGDWGLGIGDWGLGPSIHFKIILFLNFNLELNYLKIIINYKNGI